MNNIANKRTRCICVRVLGLILATAVSAVASPRTVQNMDEHWLFHLGDLRGGRVVGLR